jgi:hypothetical protein
MAVTTHMCRGNFRSSWAAEGGYDFVAEALFGGLGVDGFFLEYDDACSGGFEPLRFVPKDKLVVLGLVTTKRGELEDKDLLKRRIEDATASSRWSSCACRRSAAPPPRSRATCSLRRAGRQAPPDRRDRQGGLGVGIAPMAAMSPVTLTNRQAASTLGPI